MGENSSGLPGIRKTVPSDLDRIIEIDFKVLGQPRPDYWKAKLGPAKQSPLVSSLVAEIEGQVVGFIIGGASRWEYGGPQGRQGQP